MGSEVQTSSYSKIKRLSDKELEQLWFDFLKDKKNKTLRNDLIVQYIYLTKYVIGRMKISLPQNFSVEDISSFAIEGLIDAIEKFSPDKNARFETYAIMRMKGTVIDKIRSQDWLPRSTRKKAKEVKQAGEVLRQKLGRYATTNEIAEYMGISIEKVNAVLNDETYITSIYDKKGSGEESLEIIDTLEDKNSQTPLEKLEEKDTKHELQKALKSLPERERMIMVLYYHENMTLKEIGENIDVSESRVCQLHAQAIMKLRNLLAENKKERLKKSII